MSAPYDRSTVGLDAWRPSRKALATDCRRFFAIEDARIGALGELVVLARPSLVLVLPAWPRRARALMRGAVGVLRPAGFVPEPRRRLISGAAPTVEGGS